MSAQQPENKIHPPHALSLSIRDSLSLSLSLCRSLFLFFLGGATPGAPFALDSSRLPQICFIELLRKPKFAKRGELYRCVSAQSGGAKHSLPGEIPCCCFTCMAICLKRFR